MTRTVELVGLPHQLAVGLENLGIDLKKLGLVRHHIQCDPRAAARIEIDLLEILSGNHRRVRQRLERDCLEYRDGTRCRSTLERSRKLPAFGKFEARLHLNLAREMT